ncbi:hypothetical protein DV515_00014672 [Chloebia gouldiae]|uniref:Uncharacterized protein n=1 Tax=Chloebia gouldiae TaxID=44316 RepID=A0A3L8RXN2_CHLGU|nr:hypothetical protein DV515_00014672 [Chloebia gouldiae]
MITTSLGDTPSPLSAGTIAHLWHHPGDINKEQNTIAARGMAGVPSRSADSECQGACPHTAEVSVPRPDTRTAPGRSAQRAGGDARSARHTGSCGERLCAALQGLG